MNRRQFIALVGGAAAWPIAARAQQQTMPLIGFLNSASPMQWVHLLGAFRKGLNEVGYVEGQNVLIEYRWAEGIYDRLPVLADELVRRPVSVLVATGGATSALAAKAATTTIPIVFSSGSDPVKFGLVASLNRPGGNATGVSFLLDTLGSKRLELLLELLPGAKLIAALVNPDNVGTEIQLQDLRKAAYSTAQQLLFLHANSEGDIDTAFATIAEKRADTIMVTPDPFFLSRRERIVALAARHAVPAIYEWREFVEAGGLMSYGPSHTEMYRLIGVYTGRILNGAKPADLPVLQPTKFELVINANTAKAIGLNIPAAFFGRADAVIE